MTSDLDPAPTRLRARLTSAPAGPTGAGLTLSDATAAALARLSGGRPLEELVVLAAATALVVSSAEAVGEPGLVVAGPDGPVAFRLDLAAMGTVGEVVRATDAALRRGGAPGSHGGLTVRSTRVGSAAPAAVELTLDSRALAVRSVDGEHEPWFLDVLLRAVDQVLADFADPSRALGAVHRAAPDDVADALAWGSAGFGADPADTTLVAPIDTAVRAHPGHLAVVAGDRTLSYGELWEAAGRVAARLVELGTRPGDRVAVLTGKSIEALPAVLGVLRARAAYVPLDTQSPDARLADIIADAGCDVVLRAGDLANRLSEARVADVAEVLESRSAAEVPEPEPDDLAYVIYTSGSTGTPKGVEVTHRAIASYVGWKVGYHELDASSRVLQVPSLAFDSSVADLFPALAVGAALVLADARQSPPRELAGLVRAHGVTHAMFVPSLYRLVLPELTGTSLQVVTVAGEAMAADLVACHHVRLPGVRLVNEYGPTENSVGATAFDHHPNAGPGLPIGQPITTTVVRVGAADARPLPAGFVGELALSGRGLAVRYHGRPELTAAAFRRDDQAPGGRWYQTADLGWWRPDGLLEFAGRADDQVKVRGHRVELGEVEEVLARISGVDAAVVVAVPDHDGATMLVAFLETTVPAESVARAVADRLPPAMVPARHIRIGTLPRLASGKPDRGRLAELARVEPTAEEPASDGDSLTAAVGEIFQSVLGGAPFGPDDDFFLRGGHSLAAVAAIGKIEERLGVFVDLGDFLDVGTVREVADLVREAGGSATPAPVAAADDALWRLLDGSVDSRG